MLYTYNLYRVVNSALSLSIPVSEFLSVALELSIPAASLSFSSITRSMASSIISSNTWVLASLARGQKFVYIAI